MDAEPRGLRRAAFLDRDGVLNVDLGYVYLPSDFHWIKGAKEAIRYLNDAGYLTVVVTNQSGIARGFFTETEFANLSRWVSKKLVETEARIDAVYYCPHLPYAEVADYRIHCECRKPKPGLILQAIRDLGIDPVGSFLIGDKASDCEAAAGAGIACHIFDGSDLLQLVKKIVASVGKSPGDRNHGE